MSLKAGDQPRCPSPGAPVPGLRAVRLCIMISSISYLMTSTDFATPQVLVASPNATARPAMDRALAVLSAHKDEWARLAVAERIALIDQLKVGMRLVEERWVQRSMQAKGAAPRTLAEGEEWATLSLVYRALKFLRASLTDIKNGDLPHIPGQVSRRANGRLVAQVLPANVYERFALPGFRAEVWMEPGAEAPDGSPARARFYQQEEPKGRVALVLAAGNFASLVTGDALAKLFVEGQVLALKTNPVNAYLGPLIEEAFAPLIERGFLQIIYGGAEEGRYLAEHAAVDTLHLTGADRTYEAIVFGPGKQGRANKRKCAPIVTKPFTAELGNLTPVIVVPGPWSARDIRYQAAKMGTWLVLNSGHNCLTPRVLINHRSWALRPALNQALVDYLKRIPTRKAYYPGSFQLHQDFTAEHPEALELGRPMEGQLPWTLIPDVDSTNHEDICFTREGFYGMCAETALDAENAAEYIRKAVDFANERLWGTLVAVIVVHPKSLRDPAVRQALDQAIEDLHYGSVVVNHGGALPYYTHITPWGGAPGQDLYDIQSGQGFVNNPLMFDAPQKSVCYAPFRQIPDPYMAHSTRNYAYLRADARFQDAPNPINLLKLLWAAVRS